MPWPTKSKRPLVRTTFAYAAIHDPWLKAYRGGMKAKELAAADWLLYRVKCCPWKPGTQAEQVYSRAFERERRENPDPGFAPIPDLPRARQTPPDPAPFKPDPYTRTRPEIEPAFNRARDTLRPSRDTNAE